MSPSPRQRDIAKLAGVSQTTVSLVLNGRTAEHGINKETEQKVLTAIRELGYVPNITARALRKRRNGLIGVHTFERLFPTSKESYYEEFMIGIERQAISSGQDLVLFTSMHQEGSADPSIFREGQNRLRIADGAIILGFDQHDDELARLAAEGFPFVFIGRREKAATLMPYVTADYHTAVTGVVSRVHEHGHRRAAYLGLRIRAEPRIERHDAFVAACAATGTAIVEETSADPGELDRAWLERVLGAGATVLVVESATHLEELAAICACAGVPIPERLSVVGLDTAGGDTAHAWTHVTVPLRAIGARAVEILLDVLDGRRELTHHERLACGFEPGATLARPL
ncbi:LacI family DNA-binding transcriptional regulator [Nonomuraea rubra]|uniref:LacI family DNA-binding transcriptional regulator n=1 Tax=Nonomuraea rubra TaxID=46180 RepID=UPI0033EF8FF7